MLCLRISDQKLLITLGALPHLLGSDIYYTKKSHRGHSSLNVVNLRTKVTPNSSEQELGYCVFFLTPYVTRNLFVAARSLFLYILHMVHVYQGTSKEPLQVSIQQY